MKKQFENPEFRKAYEEGLEALRVGVKVAQLREKLGLTQTQLAAMLHTSPSVISRIENGENVELKTLQKIAQALNAKLKIELVPV
ncbi:helix-turn-helix transcriptional regulator [Candidatus Acetothermia bacterium]|nr:helix-turn-helix transcriptional regulator [Candidatus Acetothermia bacterium]